MRSGSLDVERAATKEAAQVNETLQWFLIGWSLLVSGCTLMAQSDDRTEWQWTVVLMLGIIHVAVGAVVVMSVVAVLVVLR